MYRNGVVDMPPLLFYIIAINLLIHLPTLRVLPFSFLSLLLFLRLFLFLLLILLSLFLLLSHPPFPSFSSSSSICYYRELWLNREGY